MTRLTGTWVQWSGTPGGHWSSEERALRERQDNRCAVCRREDPLHLCRTISPARGGTNYIGNYVYLCTGCRDMKNGRLLIEVRRMVRRFEQIAAEVDAGRHPYGYRPRTSKLARLAFERGFLRSPDLLDPVLATDPDACTCRHQAPHVLGSWSCRDT